MKRKVLFVVCTLLLFSGCGQAEETLNNGEMVTIESETQELSDTDSVEIETSTPISEKEYEFTKYYLRVQEPDATRLLEIKKAVIYHGEYADYYMDEGLSEEGRNYYVDTCERALGIIIDELGLNLQEESKLQIYAAEKVLYYIQDEKQCAIGPEYAGTSVQAAMLLQSILDAPTANYGLLQAVGMYVAEELGWDCSYVPAIDMANSEEIETPKEGVRYELNCDKTGAAKRALAWTQEQQFLLDFEYPCYVANYVTEEEAQLAWQMTKDFAAYLEEEGKIDEAVELLRIHNDLKEFEQSFVNLRNEWLAYLGTDIVLEVREYPVQYGSFGRFALLQMKTLHGNWYVSNSFAMYEKSEKYNQIFKRDYREVVQVMQSLEQELDEMKEILADEEYAYQLAEFYLENVDYNNYAGYFDMLTKTDIYAERLSVIVHEYCHYLLLQEGLAAKDGKILQAYEGQHHLLPYYYGSKSQWNCIEKDIVSRWWDEGDEEALEVKELLYQAHPDTILEQEDWLVKFCDAYCYIRKYSSIKDDDYDRLTSFSHYLANTYGEEFLYKVATGNGKVEELVGYTWEELVEEWKQYLEEIYGM